MYRYLLFDMDGTLSDPIQAFTGSLNYSLGRMNVPPKTTEELRPFVGPPLRDSFVTLCGFTPEQCEQAMVYCREYAHSRGMFEHKPYDGIETMLQVLKEMGRILIVATSKPEVFARKILTGFGFDKYFDFISAATLDTSRTQKTDIIRFALEQTGITDLTQAVMIGDREHDVRGANEFGMDTIGVLWGYGDRAELLNAGAKLLAETPADIPNLVSRE